MTSEELAKKVRKLMDAMNDTLSKFQDAHEANDAEIFMAVCCYRDILRNMLPADAAEKIEMGYKLILPPATADV